MKFSVPISGYGDPRHPNVACFVDYVRAVVSALRKLGHEVVRPGNDWKPGHPYGRPIVFGSQNQFSVDSECDPGSFMPADAILYNSEQTGARGMDAKRIFDAVQTWTDRLVWDYSEMNAKVLRAMGCKRVVLCPVAYDDVMTRITALPPEKEDIDVLFVGSVASPESIMGVKKSGITLLDRGQILDDLKRAGLKVFHIFGRYDVDVDPFIARSKIVLNLHYYEGAVFEIFRCSQLLANRKCVVTEDGGTDEVLEDFAKKAMVYSRRKDIVETCRALIGDRAARRIAGLHGFNLFAETSLADNIEHALEQS